MKNRLHDKISDICNNIINIIYIIHFNDIQIIMVLFMALTIPVSSGSANTLITKGIGGPRIENLVGMQNILLDSLVLVPDMPLKILSICPPMAALALNLTLPTSTVVTGGITITAPKEAGMTYSIDGITYTNITGIFTTLPPGVYQASAKNASGCITQVTPVRMIPFINLGLASGFSIFSIDGAISITDPLTTVTGDIGSMAGALTIPVQLSQSKIHKSDSIAILTAAAITNAYTELTITPCNSTIPVLLGNGQVITSGAYCIGAAATLEGCLTFDGEGDPNTIFIIKIDGAFATGTASTITVINSASFNNVYWLITGATTIGASSTFQGSLLTTGAVSMAGGVSIAGRLLSTAGAISSNGINNLSGVYSYYNCSGIWLGVTSHSWDLSSNWCGGIPNLATEVVIPVGTPFSPHIDVPTAQCHNLIITAGATLTIDPANSLTVAGELVNSAGISGLILASDASGTGSLLHNTNNVPATVERYITGNIESWHFISSPVATQLIGGSWIPSGTYGNGTGYDLYLWNEPTNCWIYKLNTSVTNGWQLLHPSAFFGLGHGYLYSVQSLHSTKTFTGILNNGKITIPLTTLSPKDSIKGFNLVGNPYPSTIDWQSVSGWSRSGLVPSGLGADMWIWNPEAGNYGVCNSSSGTGTNSVTRYIAPMQGFFVRAADSGNLGISNSARLNIQDGIWKSESYNPLSLSVKVVSEADRTSDEVRLSFGYPDNNHGATKLFSPIANAPSLYVGRDINPYAVQYLTDTIENPDIQLRFKAGRDGNYTLTSSFLPNYFKTVLLVDGKSNIVIDLNLEPTYQFTASSTDPLNRFSLRFIPVKVKKKELQAAIFTVGTHIVVDMIQINEETTVSVYDVLGRKLYQNQLPARDQHTLNFFPGAQLLIIRLENHQGTLTRKIAIPPD